MSNIEFGTSHALAKDIFGTYFMLFNRQNSFFSKFVGEDQPVTDGVFSTSENAIVQIFQDFRKDKGDDMILPMIGPVEGAGVPADGTLEDNEEAPSFYDCKATLKQTRNALRSAGKLSDQRPAFSVKAKARPALAIWLTHQLDGYGRAALSGTASSDANIAADAPSRKRVGGQTIGTTGIGTVYAVSGNLDASFNATAANNYMGPQWAKYIKRTARATEPVIEPVSVDGGERFIMFIHPYQSKALTNDWEYLNSNWHAGVRGSKNPIFTGAIADLHGVVFHEYEKIETRLGAGTSTATEYFESGDDLANGDYGARALFCGKQALIYAFGRMPSYRAETFDYGNQWGVAIGCQVAVKRSEFNAVDQGVITVDTQYAAD